MRTKIRVNRIIVYLILFGIAYYFHYFLQSHFFLILMVLIPVLPVISLAALPVLAHYLSVELSVSTPISEKDTVSYLELGVKNRSILMSLDVKIHLRAENVYYGLGQDVIISMPARIRGTYKQLIPMRLSRLGRVIYTVDSFRVSDLMGFVELRKKVNVSGEEVVLPAAIAMPRLRDMNELSTGMTESDESSKRGNDFSDVTDVREYIPGDKLMSIHWKLSAKRDILMVKDRTSMSDQQMLILADVSGTPEQVDEVLGLTYNLCGTLTESGIYVRLLWWNEGLEEFEERVIDHRENLKEAFQDLYHAPLYKDGGMLIRYLANIRPELKGFVRIRYAEGKTDAEIISLD